MAVGKTNVNIWAVPQDINQAVANQNDNSHIIVNDPKNKPCGLSISAQQIATCMVAWVCTLLLPPGAVIRVQDHQTDHSICLPAS